MSITMKRIEILNQLQISSHHSDKTNNFQRLRLIESELEAMNLSNALYPTIMVFKTNKYYHIINYWLCPVWDLYIITVFAKVRVNVKIMRWYYPPRNCANLSMEYTSRILLQWRFMQLLYFLSYAFAKIEINFIWKEKENGYLKHYLISDSIQEIIHTNRLMSNN